MNSKLKQSSIDKIIQIAEQNIDFSIYENIYVGFSGGADSTALLIILKKLSGKYKFKLHAVHFEHGLRGKESIADAEWCRDFCNSLNIPIQEFSLDVKSKIKSGEGIEACARRLRLAAFESLIDSETDAIALGHHLDDKIENFFIRLIRGSNSSGLTSLRTVSSLKEIKILRPLLRISKIEIENFLRQAKINDWKIDHTNSENLYRRNIIRNQILPELYKTIPESKLGIIRAEEALEDDADFIEQISREKYLSLFINNIFPNKLNIDIISRLHPAVRTRIFRYWFRDLLGFELIPSRNLILRINTELSKRSSEIRLIPLFDKIFLRLKGNYISLSKSNHIEAKNFKQEIWNWSKNPIIRINNYTIKAEITEDLKNVETKCENYVYFDHSTFPENLYIKTWENGDKFIPYGSTETIKVKRVFKNKKIAAETRKQVPLICLPDQTIIWVAGLKRSSFAPVTSKTVKIVFFSITK